MEKHRLYRAGTLRRLRAAGVTVLAIAVLAEMVVALHPHFHLARLFAFHALYGFASCAMLILLARFVGMLIKRPDDYYDG